jgi:hypothetical protein
MPWKSTGKKNSRGQKLYRSPSGKLWTKKQIGAYKATGGFKRAPRPKRR